MFLIIKKTKDRKHFCLSEDLNALSDQAHLITTALFVEKVETLPKAQRTRGLS